MSDQTIGLYIGKFQPFHNGHLSAVRYISSEVDKLIIVIGSSQYGGTKDQPFSAAQRRHMITKSITAEGLPMPDIIDIPDIHDPSNWVAHVRKFVPDFDIVYTNNDTVCKLFEAKAFTVAPIPFLDGVSGTLVRHKMAALDTSWTTLVPEKTVMVIHSDSMS